MITVVFRPDLNLVHWTLVGEVTTDEITAQIEAVVGDSPYVPGMDQLSDDRRMDSVFTDADLDSVVEATKAHYGPLGRRFKCAAVFNTDVQYGIGRVFTVKAEGTPIDFGAFRDLQAAKEWLGIAGDSTIV